MFSIEQYKCPALIRGVLVPRLGVGTLGKKEKAFGYETLSVRSNSDMEELREEEIGTHTKTELQP